MLKNQRAIYIGKNHKKLNYGYTGAVFITKFTEKNSFVLFWPDGNKLRFPFLINKQDVYFTE